MDPDSSIWLSAAISVFFLILTAFVAAAETALTSLNRIDLRALVERNTSQHTAIHSLLEDPHRSMTSLLVLNGFGLVGATSAVTFLVLRLAQTSWLGVAILFATALLLIALAQIVPKAWAASRPDRVAAVVAGPVQALATLLGPLIRLFHVLSLAIGRLVGSEAPLLDNGLLMSEEELRLLVGASEEEGLIEEEEKEMIAGIFELGKTLAREVMVPRISIVAVEADTPLLEALDVIIQAGHSRIPVYRGSIDNIIGILYAKDLLTYLRDGQVDVPLCDIVREPYFIPESKRVDDLLQELQQRKVHIAIVVDEYGGTAGLVTIEDLIEEIVGEIQDEYDREEPIMEKLSEDEIIFNARVDVDDVNRIMSLDLPTDNADTLGGLVFSKLGKVPSQGDQVRVDGVTIEVVSIAGRRIKKVRLIRDRLDEASAVEGEIGLGPVEDRDHSSLLKDVAA